MSKLNHKERELVALGAALASNCIPCITYHIAESKKAGLTEEQIKEAVDLADAVRKVPAQQVLGAAYAHLEGAGAPADTSAGCAPTTDCGC